MPRLSHLLHLPCDRTSLVSCVRGGLVVGLVQEHVSRLAADEIADSPWLEEALLCARKMHPDEVETDVSLVSRLLAAQFPEWADLPIEPVDSAGTDNALYRLGDDMAVRLPRIHWATGQVDKEHRWLPRLAPLLPLAVPIPLAKGKPGEGYPWEWSVCRWLEGENATIERIADPRQAAAALAEFVAALRRPAPDTRSPQSSPITSKGWCLQMREPPKLAEEAVVAALRAHYDIPVTALTFLPLGNDSASAAYRVDAADGAAFFLKVRTASGFSLASLAVPRYLQDRGVPSIVAPLPTLAQTLWVDVDGFALSLYPYLDGRIGADAGLSAEQWRAFGALVREVHSSQLPEDLLRIVPRETYVPNRRGVVADLEATLAGLASAGPAARELAAFWRARRDEIRTLVDRADALGRELRQASAPLVLCHADLHTWNVLLDAAEQLWLVDWDETVLAPKERDLMFVVGGLRRGLVTPDDTERFLQGYGDTELDPRALAYFRYAWAVWDIGEYAERVLFLPDISEEARRAAVRGLMSLFEPGSIVDLALAS